MIVLHSPADLSAYLRGGWFEREDGVLYVVPEGDREPVGPDDEVMAALLRGGFETTWSGLCRTHRLSVVPYASRRWSPQEGFHRA